MNMHKSSAIENKVCSGNSKCITNSKMYIQGEVVGNDQVEKGGME